MEKKSIHLPRIDGLDNLVAPNEILAILDSRGIRGEINSINWPEKCPSRPLASFVAAYSSTGIYVDFLVRCNYLRAENYTDQSPVSEDSCVEFFIDPKGDGEYWNFEFNCIGTINASRRFERPNPTRLSTEQLSEIKRYSSCGTRPFCEMEGLFTWNLLIFIPFSLIGLDPDNLPEKISGNFYKCASATSEPHYLSWNPILTPTPDFHQPQFFGDIYLDK